MESDFFEVQLSYDSIGIDTQITAAVVHQTARILAYL